MHLQRRSGEGGREVGLKHPSFTCENEFKVHHFITFCSLQARRWGTNWEVLERMDEAGIKPSVKRNSMRKQEWCVTSFKWKIQKGLSSRQFMISTDLQRCPGVLNEWMRRLCALPPAFHLRDAAVKGVPEG